uniref:CSON007261 protein n=1 Tax=Culicoides sonorensis TaxID=179676 RepID=A0A336MV71_CULSO
MVNNSFDDKKEILEDDNVRDNGSLSDEKAKKTYNDLLNTAWIHKILLNRTIRVVILTAVIAICLPTFVYMIFYSRELNPTNYKQEYGTCGYYDIYHLPCGPKVMEFSLFCFFFFFCMLFFF